MNNPHGYGVADNSYKAAGELDGITRLVNDFYDFMESLPEARTIRDMHGDRLLESRKKLAFFLSGWLGGPKLFSQNYYPIRIPMAHSHLAIGEAERDAWMLCMKKAVAMQSYEATFKEYLIDQLWVPAERIRQACSKS
ncbi:MAG: group II truncated hemoglobin [Candidatus Pelagadaptatus aseana]|uniref:group II truncated hemoglobin n=1 Tax=Candidatus Pelagadaptatus aseana TaxID=3120508 RepID=UPI0039B2A3EB